MAAIYAKRSSAGFGKPPVKEAGAKTRAKPLKKPSQARAKFTVQAIYDAFVRIWRSKGWTGVTTRAVALETGIAVGTFYDYFPNKQALLSGYIRHCLDILLHAIEQDVVQMSDLSWQERIRRLVRLTAGVGELASTYFDADMLYLESQIAEPKHHRRVYEEMLAQWRKAFAACSDLPQQPTSETVNALMLSVFGGRRYLLLVQPHDFSAEAWVEQLERLCQLAVTHPVPTAKPGPL